MSTLRSASKRMGPATWARALSAALALALAAAVLPLDSASAALGDAESRMISHINSTRAGGGLAALTPHDGLRRIARNWAAQMAADHDASDDRQGTLRHNPSLSSQLPGSYRRAGENVGYTVLTGASHATLVDRLHDSYMDSPAHRANISGDYDRVGAGLVTSADGTMWSAVVFMLEKHEQDADSDGGSGGGGDDTDDTDDSDDGGSGGSGDGGGGDDTDDSDDGGSGGGGDSGKSRNSGDSGREPAGGQQRSQRAGSQSEPTSRELAARAHPPTPEPPTTEELFGARWPKGYLAGDRDAALTLLAGRSDARGPVSLLPGSLSNPAPRLLGHQVTGI